jgi:hypothetical protein
VTALALLFVHEDPASWQTATGGGSTSDIVTARESLRSLALLALVLRLALRRRVHASSVATRG